MTVIHAEQVRGLHTIMAETIINAAQQGVENTATVADALGASATSATSARHTVINSVPLRTLVGANGGGLKVLPERTKVLPDGSTKVYSKCLVTGTCFINLSAEMAPNVNPNWLRNNAARLDVITFDNGFRLLSLSDNENIDIL